MPSIAGLPSSAAHAIKQAQLQRRTASIEDLLLRIRGEFREMPGLSPTLGQAARLFGLRDDVCDHALSTLIRSGFLRQSADGRFRLAS